MDDKKYETHNFINISQLNCLRERDDKVASDKVNESIFDFFKP